MDTTKPLTEEQLARRAEAGWFDLAQREQDRFDDYGPTDY